MQGLVSVWMTTWPGKGHLSEPQVGRGVSPSYGRLPLPHHLLSSCKRGLAAVPEALNPTTPSEAWTMSTPFWIGRCSSLGERTCPPFQS